MGASGNENPKGKQWEDIMSGIIRTREVLNYCTDEIETTLVELCEMRKMIGNAVDEIWATKEVLEKVASSLDSFESRFKKLMERHQNLLEAYCTTKNMVLAHLQSRIDSELL